MTSKYNLKWSPSKLENIYKIIDVHLKHGELAEPLNLCLIVFERVIRASHQWQLLDPCTRVPISCRRWAASWSLGCKKLESASEEFVRVRVALVNCISTSRWELSTSEDGNSLFSKQNVQLCKFTTSDPVPTTCAQRCSAAQKQGLRGRGLMARVWHVGHFCRDREMAMTFSASEMHA